MKTVLIEGRTLPGVYHNALCELYETPEREMSVVMKVYEPLAEPMISRCMPAGPHELEQYRQEMLYGILDFEVERGNWHYTYHQRMERWKQSVIDELERDEKSRRAVISIRDNAEDAGSADPACLQSIQYMIRDGKLHCWVLFRSNDAVKASFMNMFALIMLQKEFTERLGVEIGEYNHTANSYHCYPEDEETLARYAKRIEDEVDMNLRYKEGNHCYILTEDHGALSYPYNGGWDALMDAEKPSIEEMVAEQRRKYMAEKKSCANCGRECRMRQEENAAKQGCFDFKEKNDQGQRNEKRI